MNLLSIHFQKILTIVALVLFVGILVVALFKHFDPAASSIANIIVGGMISLLTTILTYWFGSSKGSADKTDIIKGMNQSQGNGSAS